MSIHHHLLPTHSEEITWVCSKIKEYLALGVNPGEIAVIARTHQTLESVVTCCHHQSIPISYERGQNVLFQQHIQQIIVLLKFIHSLNQTEISSKYELLPTILSFPFWQIPSLDIWKISIKAYEERISWLGAMINFGGMPEKVALLLIELAHQAKNSSLEKILDEIMGVDLVQVEEDVQSEIGETLDIAIVEDKFRSPFKKYYFDGLYNLDKPMYVELLSGLKTFIQALRNYKPRQTLYVHDFIEFLEILETNNIQLINSAQYNNQLTAVNILTAHKAKGMEFEVVFIINCTDAEWASKGKPRLLKLPQNLPLSPQSDDQDDNIRLLYVAITRAKTELHFSSYKFNDSGKEILPLSYLQDLDIPLEKPASNITESLEMWVKPPRQTGLSIEEINLLQPLLKNYRLSVTHLTNFLDVTNGGPHTFLEHNLLRFPQSKSASARYGTAMHEAMRRFYLVFKQEKSLPSKETLLDFFHSSLALQRFTPQDYQEFLRQGQVGLSAFYEQKYQEFDYQSWVEFDFREPITIGQAIITGKIDKMVFDSPQSEDGLFDQDSIGNSPRNILVTDYKTGNPLRSWQGKTDFDKIKLWKYKTQLIFYKLLVEGYSQFRGRYTVNRGCLEFLQPEPRTKQILTLHYDITVQDVETTSRLIEVVFQKIMNLDFPQTESYSQNFAGIEAFIQDLVG